MRNNTLEELVTSAETEYRQELALIRECVGGLTQYATRIAQSDRASPMIADLRSLVENLAIYWGLDSGDPAILDRNYLQPFDQWTKDADTDMEIYITPKQCDAIVQGLYRYCGGLLVDLDNEAKGELLHIKGIMTRLASEWGFESKALDCLITRIKADTQHMNDWRTAAASGPSDTLTMQFGGLS